MIKYKKLAITIFLAAALSGCNKNEEKNLQLEYREEGITFLQNGEYDQAIDSLTSALQESKGKVTEVEVDITYYLAETEYKSGDMEAARNTYSNLISFKEKESKAYYLRGLTYLQEDIAKAKEDFTKAVELDKKNYELPVLIYQNLKSSGYEEDGLVYLQNALEIKGDKAENYSGRGRIYYLMNDMEKAIIELNKAVEKKSVDALYYLGLVYERMGKPEEAITQYETCLEQDDSNAEVYNQLGLCKLSKEDYQGAMESFEAGIALEDESFLKTLLFNQIVVYERMSDFQTAKQKMEDYLGKYPGDETALREYEFLKTR